MSFEIGDDVTVYRRDEIRKVVTAAFLNRLSGKPDRVLETSGGVQQIFAEEDMILAPIEYTPAQVRELREVLDACMEQSALKIHPLINFVGRLEKQASNGT